MDRALLSVRFLEVCMISLLLAAGGAGCRQPSASEIPPGDPRGLQRLLGSDLRPFEPRFSHLAGCSPCLRGTTEGDALPNAACDSLDRLDGPARERLDRSSPAFLRRRPGEGPYESPGAAGSVLLLYGHLEKAERAFREAAGPDTTERTASAATLSDLGAALLVRGRAENRPVHLLEAIEVLSRAIDLPEAPAAPFFNRGLALRDLGRFAAAQEDFLQAVARAPGPSCWRRAAQRQLEALPVRSANVDLATTRAVLDRGAFQEGVDELIDLVARRPQIAREHSENELLARWAKAHQEGAEHRAAVALDSARLIGRALRDRGGDRMVEASVTAIDRAARDDRVALDALAEGHVAWALAHSLAPGGAPRREQLERARDALRRGASPFLLRIVFELETELYRAIVSGGTQGGKEPLLSLQSRYVDLGVRAGDQGLLSLATRAAWMEGLISSYLGHYAAARRSYDRGLALTERSGEREDRVLIERLLAEAHQQLGDRERAWQARYRGLMGEGYLSTVRRRRQLLAEAGRHAVEDSPRLALALYDDLGLLTGPEDLAARIDTALNRARALTRIDHRDEAKRAIDDGRAALAASTDESTDGSGGHRRLTADLAVAEAGLLIEENPDRAIELLDDALAYYRSQGQVIGVPNALLLRASASLRREDYTAAEADLDGAITLVQNQAGVLSEAADRRRFLDESRALYDGMIGFLVDRDRGLEDGFRYAERSRAQVLLAELASSRPPSGRGALHSGLARTVSLDEVQAALPETAALVAYRLLPERGLAWVVTREQRFLQPLAISSAEADHLVTQMVSGLRRGLGAEDLHRVTSRLHEALLGPILRRLPATHSLFVVPDGPLNGLPFAALRDELADTYLIQERPVLVTPSATFLLRALARDRELAARPPGKIVVVAEPAIDRELYAGLSPLDGALRQGNALRELYADRSPTVLAGADATWSEMSGSVAEAEIVHYAGHAISIPETPWLSGLVLAPEPGEPRSGFVATRKLYGLRLDRARLVVLSACSTAAGRISPTDGSLSLVRPFLASGAPAVIASLWRAEDVEAEALLHQFHRSLRAGASVPAALRAAQLFLIRSAAETGYPPGSWAGFQVFGGTVLQKLQSSGGTYDVHESSNP